MHMWAFLQAHRIQFPRKRVKDKCVFVKQYSQPPQWLKKIINYNWIFYSKNQIKLLASTFIKENYVKVPI